MKGRSARRCCTLLAALVLLALPRISYAWKPYTHNYVCDVVLSDLADGLVTIAGHEYTVPTQIVQAVLQHQDHYQAGCVGPDVFPDITFGQAVIHPTNSGQWMRYVLQEAWAAQSQGAFTEERQQILAFAYGFLTHAAGDVWGHTFVNDFASEIFPAYLAMMSNPPLAEIAVRHIISEGVVQDATPGFDGNPDRGSAPGGDVSDTSTVDHLMSLPMRFVYEKLVNPSASTPVAAVPGKYSEARGPLLGLFLDLRQGLAAYRSPNIDPVQDVINAYDETVAAFHDLAGHCDEVWEFLGPCEAAFVELGFNIFVDSVDAFLAVAEDAIAAAAYAVLEAYINAWLDDIDRGLEHWGDFGIALARGMVSPQTRRDLQNDECQYQGSETGQLRIDCENGVGMFSVVMHQSEPFITQHLLSMVGFPDFFGDMVGILLDVSDLLGDITDIIGLPFNPVLEVVADAKEWVKEEIIAALGLRFLDEIERLEKTPTVYMCSAELPLQFPDPIGTQTLQLFPAQDHTRLDGFMGLTVANHVPMSIVPEGCGPLTDSTTFNAGTFAAFKNTIALAKMVLLPGEEMNRLLSETSHRAIATYGSSEVDNVMTTTTDSGLEWLKSIDGDHAWRANAYPRFPARLAANLSGGGNFPLWESCVLRGAFRDLFSDWEGGAANFPDYGDDTSPDVVNDPNAPSGFVTVTGPTYTDGAGRRFLGGQTLVTVSAIDTPADRAFPPEALGLEYRVYSDPSAPGGYLSTVQGGVVLLSVPDGRYFVDLRAADPCHPSASGTATVVLEEYYLDTTAATLTCGQPPFGATYDTDDAPALQFTIDDGELGSGVAQSSAIVDGYGVPTGTQALTLEAPIDMYQLYPGTRSVVVQATDNMGNAGAITCTFTLHGTSASLLANLDRANSEGFITDPSVYQGLRDSLVAANRSHARGHHETEHNQLQAFMNQLSAQRGKGIDAVKGDLFTAWAEDLVAVGG